MIIYIQYCLRHDRFGVNKVKSYTAITQDLTPLVHQRFKVYKGTVSVILSDPPCKKSNPRFTTIHLKHVRVRRVQRYMCVNLSKLFTNPCIFAT